MEGFTVLLPGSSGLMVTIPPKDLERPAIPILDHVMMRSKAGVDECFQVLPDRFASMPIGNAEIANCIFRKAVEAFAEGLVVDFFPEC
jgi:hypothetical protein